MASDVRAGRRERAEAYAREAAEAAQRGDHRKAAMLYQAAFMALEGDELAAGERSREHANAEEPHAAAEADCLDEAG